MYVGSFLRFAPEARFHHAEITLFEESGVIEQELLKGEYEEGGYGCLAMLTNTDTNLELLISEYLLNVS